MQEYLRIGIVLKPQGIMGELKVQALTDDANRFLDLQTLSIERKDGYEEVGVTVNRVDGEYVYLYLEGTHSRDSAEHLRNVYLAVLKEDGIPLGENRWFICDLEGLDVQDEKGSIGTLVEVISTGGVDVYRVEKMQGGHMMFPALTHVIDEVNIQKGYMKLNHALYEVAVDED